MPPAKPGLTWQSPGPRYSQGRAVSILRSIESAIALLSRHPSDGDDRRSRMLSGCAQDGSGPASLHRSRSHHQTRATAANPLVDGLALLLFVRVVVPLERCALEGVLE
jgi:hypothetical protein